MNETMTKPKMFWGSKTQKWEKWGNLLISESWPIRPMPSTKNKNNRQTKKLLWWDPDRSFFAYCCFLKWLKNVSFETSGFEACLLTFEVKRKFLQFDLWKCPTASWWIHLVLTELLIKLLFCVHFENWEWHWVKQTEPNPSTGSLVPRWPEDSRHWQRQTKSQRQHKLYADLA